MNAGAVMLTDCIYWIVIFPFLTIKDYNLNFVSSAYKFIGSIVIRPRKDMVMDYIFVRT